MREGWKKINYARIMAVIIIHLTLISLSWGARVGLKVGIDRNVLDVEGAYRNKTGNGFHVGIDVTFDIRPYYSISITPQLKSSQYNTLFWPGTDYDYVNLYVPVIFSMRLPSSKSISPYLGLGAAVNFQLSGKMIYTDGVNYGEQEIEDLKPDIYLATTLGIAATFGRLQISPEVSLNYNLTDNSAAHHAVPEGRSVWVYDYGLTLGLSYSL